MEDDALTFLVTDRDPAQIPAQAQESDQEAAASQG
jgi:hypothetical protein